MKTIARPFMFFKEDVQRILRYLNVRMSEAIPAEGQNNKGEEWARLKMLSNRITSDMEKQWPTNECKTLHGIVFQKEFLNAPMYTFPCSIMNYKPLALPKVKQVRVEEVLPNDLIHIPKQKGVMETAVGKVTTVSRTPGGRWAKDTIQIIWEGSKGYADGSVTLFKYQWDKIRIYKEVE